MSELGLGGLNSGLMYCIIMMSLVMKALLMCFLPFRLCFAFHNSDNKDGMH